MTRDLEYAARLFLAWLNERYGRSFAPSDLDGPPWRAEDEAAADAPGGRIVLVADRLSEARPEWEQRCRELEARLDESRPGSYVLWVPPGGKLPREEPDESEWVRRIVLAASRLASGRKAEARLPVKMVLAKVRDEGGYANVLGGLSRHWTTVTEKVNGTFYLDSNPLKRLTRDEDERTQLFEHIALLSQGVEKGEAIEFEHEDAWSVQRLPRGPAGKGLADGWAITGCPEGFDPVRRRPHAPPPAPEDRRHPRCPRRRGRGPQGARPHRRLRLHRERNRRPCPPRLRPRARGLPGHSCPGLGHRRPPRGPQPRHPLAGIRCSLTGLQCRDMRQLASLHLYPAFMPASRQGAVPISRSCPGIHAGVSETATATSPVPCPHPGMNAGA